LRYWRRQWEESMTPGMEQKLRAYDSSDCEALEFVVKALWRFDGKGANQLG
jgi:hypothetical protein